jgi:hypothetical protein
MLAGMNARTPVPVKPDFSARARSDLVVREELGFRPI